MTELFIDKQPVVLPEAFSITIIDENPFFTKNGKYTYDITLSLLDPINARIYNHLNRRNRKGSIPKNRSAYLIVDNEVVLNGTEVILEYSESEVKIQLVSGNSELNFLIGGDRKLRDLDLGEASPYKSEDWRVTARMVYDDLNKGYPERDWILAPYTAGYDIDLYGSGAINKSLLHIGNQFTLPNYTQMPGIENTTEAKPQYEASYSGQIPQPYLCFIIRKVLESLGYVLEYNALEEDPVRSQVYIVHGYRTLKFAKMLPNWTVTDFFDHLETWLDAITIVDAYRKTVRIEFNYQAAESSDITELDVLDEYTAEVEEDNNTRIQTSNVAYDLDSDDYYLYMNLTDFVRKNTKDKKIPFSSISSLMERIEDPAITDNYEHIFVVKNPYYVGDFIAYKLNNINTVKKIDSFKPLMNNPESEDIDITLKIVPASFVSVVIETIKEGSGLTSDFWVQIPVAEDYDDLLTQGGENTYPGDDAVNTFITNIQEAIGEESGEEEVKGGTRLRLALYAGLKILNRKRLGGGSGGDPVIFSARYPTPFVEGLYEDFTESKQEKYMSIANRLRNPFRLEEMNEDIYSRLVNVINTNEVHKLSFINPKISRISDIFLVRNKQYRCIKIERTVTQKGFNSIAKGEFYPHKHTDI